MLLYTDSPDDPQLRALLAQLHQVITVPISLLPLSQLQRRPNVKAVLPTLTTVQPN